MQNQFAKVEGSPIVVISGASSGIGKDSALFLNQLGYTVAAGVRRTTDGEALRAEASNPERFFPLLLDVTSDVQVNAAREEVERRVTTGLQFAGLFSNAGIVHLEGDTSSEGTPMATIEEVMDINFFGAIRFIRAFLPLARTSRGTIVVNSALMARTVLPFNGGYAASKCALEGWTDSLRREVSPLGVRVVLIEAAAISTGLTHGRDHGISEDNPYPIQRQFLEKSFASSDTHRNDPRCSPRRVSELVAHALQAKRPRCRYHVGGGARAISAVGRLPERVQDYLLEQFVSRSKP
jgi:NAD(P)-dependent dehydrogenase (short-subunit alcohol dehydrogenase family)